ncbi:MAG: hypothetical protein U9Q79_06025 [Candidatus Hydrogenedentes bacterium]|nr:hypothetical protein [Candidatus Hydrogenedentota bacterium]
MIFIDAVLHPGTMIVGLASCTWAFWRSRKVGYAIIAVYFVLRLFSVLLGPAIGQMIVERHSPELLELQEKMEQATQEVIEQHNQAVHGHLPTDDIWIETEGKVLDLHFVPVFLVVGLWLVVRREGRDELERDGAQDPA